MRRPLRELTLSPLGPILHRVAAGLPRTQRADLHGAWERAVGSLLARKVTVEGLHEGVLGVRAADPVWTELVRPLLSAAIPRLVAEGIEVTRIELRGG